MPITSTFDPHSPEVITPTQMVRPIQGFPTSMIVTFQPYTFDVLLENYETKPLVSLNLEEDTDTSSVVGQAFSLEYRGHTLGACLSPVGAPMTVAVLEKAIAHGVKNFVVFGTCGTLVPNLQPGVLIIPNAAYRDEGTSYHYAAASDFIVVETATKTAEILSEMKIPHLVGRVWTTDAFFRETQANMANRVAQGCIAVDMESSAMAALAQYRGVAIHHFIYAADNLAEQSWDPGILGTLPAEPRGRYVRLALEMALRLETP